MKTSIPRLRSIQYKDGRTLTILRPKHENVAGRLKASVEKAIDDKPEDVVAYALIVWDISGMVFPAYYIGDRSPLPAGQIPQLVKDVLLAEMAARWAKD